MIGYSADLAVGVWIGAGAEEGAEDLKASLPATAVSVWSTFVKETLSAVPK
jgi:membrane carboxypeptidase/penicillin-binding protein